MVWRNLSSLLSRLGKASWHLVFTLFVALGLIQNIQASDDQGHGRGLKPLAPEHIEEMEQNWPRIIGIKPNKIGNYRIQEHLKQNALQGMHFDVATSSEDEFILIKGSEANRVTNHFMDTKKLAVLPRAVDNSKLPSFPPIGDQRDLGACVGWASTYYQASHEIGLLNGINNKTSFGRVLSPKWTYNLLNQGSDGGLNILDAYNLLAQNGATTIVNFPYDSDFKAWDLNLQDWEAAISNRLAPPQLVSGISSGDPQSLQLIKEILNNGHILTIGTYVDSWVFTTVKNDPNNPNNPYVGQQAVSWMNGSSGGHHTTIVGYNDDIWIDINESGQVDPGEKGAFLVANSWGTSWGNAGFMWVAYDAFLTNSAVPNGPSVGRVPLGDAFNSNLVNVVPKAANYVPSLVAEFSLTQAIRNQISVEAGISDNDQNAPTKTFLDYALNNQGGAYAFDGTDPSNPQTATFALDLTDLLPAGSTPTNRYYLSIQDNAAGNPTTLNSFTLVDKVHAKQVISPETPLTCDNGKIIPFVAYDFDGDIPANPPVVNITSLHNEDTIQGSVNVTVNATSNIGIDRVDFYIDAVLYQTDSSSPYIFSIDTTKLTNGTHKFSAFAYDTGNHVSETSMTIHVANYPKAIYINAGAGAVAYDNVTWQMDQSYTLPSWTYSNPRIFFANPVYKTERYGQFSYTFNVPNGYQNVKLKFAEIYFKTPGKRIFNVFINGIKVLSNLDLVKVAGFGVPYDRTFRVPVAHNQIKIDFVPVVDNAKVSAISITPVL